LISINSSELKLEILAIN